jgi:hypothetical protein
MNALWLEIFTLASSAADKFVYEKADKEPTNYQFKWNVVRSITTRSVAGELRHLPSKTKVSIQIRLPV